MEDIQAAQASARTGVPMGWRRTLTQGDRMEDVVPHARVRPRICFSSYTSNDKELARQLRASRPTVRLQGDRGYPGYPGSRGGRPHDLNMANFPQLARLLSAELFHR